MSLREQNKAYNRRRIIAAAEQIVRQEGMEKLSMRHLAKVAGVSLRTPYNLFGSKTQVLIAMLQEPVIALFGKDRALSAEPGVLNLPFALLERFHARVAQDQEFFRGTYWEMMRSEQPEARDSAVAESVRITLPVWQHAQAAGELDESVDIAALNRHLTILTLSLAGMWASGLFELDELVEHIRRSWRCALLEAATRAGKEQLESSPAAWAPADR